MAVQSLRVPVCLSNEVKVHAGSIPDQATSPGSRHRQYLSTGLVAQVLLASSVPGQARVRHASQKAPSLVARPMELDEDVGAWLVALRFGVPTSEPGHPAME